jgi:serine/threonine protein kinase
MSIQPGQNLGQYRLIEQIGRGGMATVFKAYQPSLDRYVAVKILSAQYASDPDFAERFRREAKAIARLRHPNILTVFDYGEEHGTTYIVMEFIDGQTLKHILGRPLELKKAAQLVTQVAGALQYAHEQGIVHRDVKPANILMTSEGRAVLSDFGIAKMMEITQQLTAAGVGIGTPEYMSPEQGMGKPTDHRSDIYSLGVVLYEMLTGRTPFSADTPYAIIYNHVNKPLPLPHTLNVDLPEAVERVALKALAKEPADRYQHANEMAEALNAAVKAADTVVGPAGSRPTVDDRATRLYTQAVEAQSAGRKNEALTLFTEVQAVSPGFRDVDRRLHDLQAAAPPPPPPPPPPSPPGDEAARGPDVDALYRQATALMNQGQWAPALEAFRKVSAINPNYQNVRGNIATVEQQLGLGLQRPSAGPAGGKGSHRGLLFGIFGGMGGLVVICAAVFGLAMAGVIPGLSGTPTPTEVAVEVTETPTEGVVDTPTEPPVTVVAEVTKAPAVKSTKVATPRPTKTPTVGPVQEVLLEDKFADNKNGWTVDGRESYLENGALHLKALDADKNSGVGPDACPNVQDFVYEATVTKVEGPDNIGYGIYFRQSTGFYYGFFVSGNGMYELVAWIDGNPTEKVPWADSDKVNQGNTTNDLKVIAQGDKISMFINNALVSEFQDDAARSGQIGLLISNQGPHITASHILLTNIATAEASPQPVTPTAASGGAILFEDNFVDNRTDWFVDGTTAYIKDNQYHMVGVDPNRTKWSSPPSFSALAMTLEATITKVSGGDDQPYGLIFERSGDFQYAFFIDSLGEYKLSSWTPDQWTDIVPWASSDTLNQGNATNTLTVVINSGWIVLMINGTTVEQIEDTHSIAGNIGFIVQSDVHLAASHIVAKETIP